MNTFLRKGCRKRHRRGALVRTQRLQALEALERRCLPAVVFGHLGYSPDYFDYQAKSGISNVDRDFEHLFDKSAPVTVDFVADINSEVIPTGGNADGHLQAWESRDAEGNTESLELRLSVQGSLQNPPNITDASLLGRFSAEVLVTDSPARVRLSGVAEASFSPPGGQYGSVISFAGPDSSGQYEFAAFSGSSSTIDETVELPPGKYGVSLRTRVFILGNEQNASANFSIDILDVGGPELNPIGDKEVNAGETLAFTATANASPETNLTWSLGSDALAGMSIDATTGAFQWTPGSSNVGAHPVTITVTDDADRRDSETISIDVLANEEFHWVNGTEGDFDAAENWDRNEVPGTDGLVFFDLPQLYTVQVGSQIVERVIVGGDPSSYVEFEDVQLAAQSTDPDAPGVVVNQGEFHLLDGVLTSNHGLIGPSAATRVELRPGGAEWQNAGRLVIGGGGEAVASVRSGARLVSGELLIGNASNGAAGRLEVSGENARVLASSTAIGNSGVGELLLDLGGRLVSSAATIVGKEAGSSGTVVVQGVDADGTPSTLRTEGLVLLGIGEDGAGQMKVIDGGRVEAQTSLTRVGTRASGSLLVSGAGPDAAPASRFVVADSNLSFIVGGEAAGDGTVDVEDGGVLDVKADVVVGHAATGRIRVAGDGDLLPSEFLIGRNLVLGNLAGGSGTLRITDGARTEMTGADLYDELETPQITFGKVEGATGKLVVSGVSPDDGTPSTMDFGYSSLVLIGAGGTGDLQVLNGGRVAGTAFIGVGEEGPGSALISGWDVASGMRSTLDGQALTVGSDNVGSLNVLDGARVAISFVTNLRSGSSTTIRGSGGGYASELETPQLLVAASEGASLETDSAVLTVSEGGVVRVLDEINIGTGGTIDTGSGSVTVGASDPTQGWLRLGPGGTLKGTGRIYGSLDQDGGIDNFAGTVLPGNSPGVLTVEGSFRQGAAGTLVIEVGGAEPGTQYDQLVVSGDVTLNGTLELQFIDGFVPGPNDSFEFLVSNATTGQFEDVVVSGLPAGMVPDLNLTPNGLSFEVVADARSTVSGRSFDDLNGDGTRQTNEPWMNGWTIHLRDRAGNIVQSQTTADVDRNGDGTIDPVTERGWYHFADLPDGHYYLQQVAQDDWHQTGPFDSEALSVWELDRDHDFRFTGNQWEDWGGRGEKWFWGTSGWHFVTPDGAVYKWNGSPASSLTGDQVVQLSPEYAADASLIFDAALPSGSRVSTVSGQDAVDVHFGNQRDERYRFERRSGTGNVTVQILGTDLHLFGDQYDNGVTIYHNIDGLLAVGGHGGTTINGSAEPFVTQWSVIPDDLRFWMYGGNDTVCLDGVTVSDHLLVDLGVGANSIVGESVHVGGTSYLISVQGDSTFGFANSGFGGPTTMITGSGADLLLARNVTYHNTLYVDTGLGDDLVLSEDSRLSRGVTLLLSAGEDRLALLGENVIGKPTVLLGGAAHDSYDFAASTRFERDPTLLEFEQNSLTGVDTLLDDVLSQLADQGLGGLL